ncbi:MAG: VWA domain-containing protein [Planctomycetes bacterium]|nr:VWA domain-containing protein [Planctomycetota bacterium]
MRILRLLAACSTSTALLTATFFSPLTWAAETARLATFARDGQTYYALSLMPEITINEADACSVVVLVDTSASQQGVYRETALAALETLLNGLRPSDQVELWAVDLDAKPMTTDWVRPGSEPLRAAVDRLREVVPLGSTDLAGALRAAVNATGKVRYVGGAVTAFAVHQDQSLVSAETAQIGWANQA